ncbi:MAG: hypothetical protein R3182_12435, partial [Draconibacterium sp.]|nr:hypothetical protein [Draconibacterium sp.]
MKKFFKVLLYIILTIVLLLGGIYTFYLVKWNRTSSSNMKLLGPEAPVLTIDGYQFRDLNKNGKLDIYEDKRQSTEAKIDDLISQMNLEEKAGMLFIHMTVMGKDGESIGGTPILMLGGDKNGDIPTKNWRSNSWGKAEELYSHFDRLN